jgi:hypothetical protein
MVLIFLFIFVIVWDSFIKEEYLMFKSLEFSDKFFIINFSTKTYYL